MRFLDQQKFTDTIKQEFIIIKCLINSKFHEWQSIERIEVLNVNKDINNNIASIFRRSYYFLEETTTLLDKTENRKVYHNKILNRGVEKV